MLRQLYAGDPSDSGKGETAKVQQGYEAIQAEQYHRICPSGESEGIWLVNRATEELQASLQTARTVQIETATYCSTSLSS